MWIYLVIAAELGLFYSIFWFYFVREPKPFKVSGNPWGKYGDNRLTAGGVEQKMAFIIDLMRTADQFAASSSLPSAPEVDRKEQVQLRLARRRRYCRTTAMSRAHLPAELFDENHHQQPLFKRILSMFGKKQKLNSTVL